MIPIVSTSYRHLSLWTNQKKWFQLRFQPKRTNSTISPRVFIKGRQYEYLEPTKKYCTTFSVQNTKNGEIVPSNTSTNNISNFYASSNIFITGATGFIGKVLLEKLLRACRTLENIHVLIREKKGLNAGQRLKHLLDSPVFDTLKETNPGCLEKVRAVYGDVGQPNLGLCETDRRLIIDKVNVVFHSAATVSFNEELQMALQINTLGTIQMAKLCNDIKNLKSFIYVSTAYSNWHRKDIDEKIYESPYNPAFVIDFVKNLPSGTSKTISQQIVGKYSNSYVFSKALGESAILEYSKVIPAAIVRPSIDRQP